MLYHCHRSAALGTGISSMQKDQFQKCDVLSDGPMMPPFASVKLQGAKLVVLSHHVLLMNSCLWITHQPSWLALLLMTIIYTQTSDRVALLSQKCLLRAKTPAWSRHRWPNEKASACSDWSLQFMSQRKDTGHLATADWPAARPESETDLETDTLRECP